MISRTTLYRIQPQIVWYVQSEAWEEDTLSPHHCVWFHLFLQYIFLNLDLSLSRTDLSLLLSVSVSLKGSICLSVIPYHLSERLIGRLCCPFLFWPVSQQKETMSRTLHLSIYPDCVFVQECMHWCLSQKICAWCLNLCVCVCECIHMRCSAPFPSSEYVQGQQLCCQDVFKSFLQEHLLCFLSAGWAGPAWHCAGVSTDY